MARRHMTTAITMLVLVGILVAGVILGMKSLLAPLPGAGEAASTPSPTCSPKVVQKGQRIRSSEVQVSVFNGGTRAGLADETMNALTKRGFTKGETANAPVGTAVKFVKVLTTEKNDMAAELVARQFGRNTKVTVTTTDLGPGIDVIVGDDFHKLVKAKRVIVVKKSSSVCVPVPTQPAATTAS